MSTISPEPRLAVKYNVTNHFRLKLAGGLYSQNLISARSDRDVVNLFYGFLSGPDNLPDEFNGKPVNDALQKAAHIILGAEMELMRNVTLNVEAYYKYFSQLTNLNRNKIYDEDKAPDRRQEERESCENERLELCAHLEQEEERESCENERLELRAHREQERRARKL